MDIFKPRIKIPKAPLARTREHHEAIWSTDGSMKPEEYQKTPAEMMSDEELRAYIETELQHMRKTYAELEWENENQVRIYRRILDNVVMPNLRYLAEIGRLPNEFNIEAIEAELRIP